MQTGGPEYNTASVFSILETTKSGPSNEIESETIEFKEYSSEKSFHNDADLPGEICALANWKGGVLICGVRDGSKISDKNWQNQLIGFPQIDPIQTAERVRGRLQNAVDLRIENVAFDGKNYLAIFIKAHKTAIVMTTKGRAYIREGRSSRPMTPEEVERAVKSLQSYDWSADSVVDASIADFDANAVESALEMHAQIRGLQPKPSPEAFLESIEATKNGHVTKGGLLFLGTNEAIRRHLGDIEFRFSWKEGVTLKKNEVWSGNVWTAIHQMKGHFASCVSSIDLEYKGNTYKVPNLDPIAFHEAFLNAVAHRDYSVDGMISVEFAEKTLTILSPGRFYGGVKSENIFFHGPRHRNKALARMLMNYKFVDRAGMGILRMSVKSLAYGRPFPRFQERSEAVHVALESHYIRTGIFVLTRERTELHVPDLVILNALYGKGHVSLREALDLVKMTAQVPSTALEQFFERWSLFVELAASKDGVFICVKLGAMPIFESMPTLKLPSNSSKLVSVFNFLKKNGTATIEDLSKLLEYSHKSTTSQSLAKIKWLEKTGAGPSSRWQLAPAQCL